MHITNFVSSGKFVLEDGVTSDLAFPLHDIGLQVALSQGLSLVIESIHGHLVIVSHSVGFSGELDCNLIGGTVQADVFHFNFEA